AATVAREKDARYLAADAHGPAIERVVAIVRRERGARRLAVASGNGTELVRATLRGAGIEGRFGVVVGADQVTRGKAVPDVFLHAAGRLGVPAERCVVYEDGELGIQAARAAGMVAIDIRRWPPLP